MGLLFTYSMKDSVTSTEICSDRNGKEKIAHVIQRSPDRRKCVALECTHVLHVVKAQRGSLAAVLQGLSGESLVVAMQEAGGRKRTRGVSRTITLARGLVPRFN